MTREEVIEKIRKQREAKAPKKPSSDKPEVKASFMDRVNDQTNWFQSMANPFLRTLSHAEQGTTGTGYFKDVLKNQRESVQRGAAARGGNPNDFRVADAIGEIVGGLAMTGRFPSAPTRMGRMATAPLYGAALGPAFAPEDTDTLEAMNTGAKWGLLAGPLFEGAGAAASKGAKFASAMGRMATAPFTTNTSAARMLNKLLGQQKPAVVKALRNTTSRVPGEKLTSGEAAASARSPEMSVLQRMVEEIDPKKYGDINAANKAARLANIKEHGGNIREMKAKRTAATHDIRKNALDQAGKLDIGSVIKPINAALADKMIPSIQRDALRDIKRNILSRRDRTGTIDAHALYTVRKEIGNTLKSIFAKNDVRWDKASTAKAERDIQKLIDDVIVKSPGGARWKDYLRTFTDESIKIENAQRANVLTDKLQDSFGKETPGIFGGATRGLRTNPSNQRLQVAADEVMESLQRRKDLRDMSMSGVGGVRKAMSLPRAPTAGPWSLQYTAFRTLINKLSDKASVSVMRRLAESFDDPAKVLELLGKTEIPIQTKMKLLDLSKQANAATAAAIQGEYKE